MAGSSLFTLIDDIASLLDDIAVMTKVATKKTAGVLGDDLALNAQQVTGVRAERELPIVWAVAKGSFKNKLILVPAALAISALAPWAITPLLMFGGAYLCFEGFEKLAHKYLHAHDEHHEEAVSEAPVDQAAYENEKIQGAVRTDFILSAEIVTISLGTVAAAPFGQQVAVLASIGIIMTVGVYGLVAGIVKLDDAGLYLSQKKDAFQKSVGALLLMIAPMLMKTLSVVGTAAMFMVGGGILTHGIPMAHDISHNLAHSVHGVPAIGGLLEAILPSLFDAVAGVIAGALALALVTVVQKALGAFKKQPAA